ncbi:sigma 54-interacting transcriptional regulator [Sporomusa termitida]|uniref:Anaerobic nitric oxide reductase transcription regulator NorR n=1 Tax=Sporomusa termitida TaxID=2377 RepID=A0A517DNF7_9FIRM|nr:sigma 54-interacting transcriptional regulator [Sporomusa termitida]QDR78888.1 Anaerobic nitric oxide reductase transcription regulator NorR [Sporomusa termitida]
MAKITFMVPYSDIFEDIQEVFTQQNDCNWTIELVAIDGVPRRIDYKKIKTDVVVARGITASLAERVMEDIPVIRLPVSGYDVIRAVLECRTRYKSQKVAIVGTEDMVYGARSINEITGIEIVTSIVDNEEDARRSLTAIKDDGITIICGGVVSTCIADQIGLQTVFIKTGREAIYQALIEAKRTYFVKKQEQERSERFRTILDYSIEGIVAVNEQGNINLINAAATDITGLKGTMEGKAADKVFPELRLGRVLSTGTAEVGEIKTLSGRQVVINNAPITVKGQVVGAIATFQPVASIQEMEGKIRRKIYPRGHSAKFSFSNIFGKSKALQRAIGIAKEYSTVDSNVLIVGETGAGKEMFSQSIHSASDRAAGPFVAFNCAALPENLLESELFGYVEGAFTGAAKEGKAGLFELAHRGTIFLDEISEISIKVQGRLLRVLQEREIMRLGDRKIIPIDVRVIAATNRDLGELIREKAFRSDLYYRLDVLELHVPPLRERTGDVLQLFAYFLHSYCSRFGKPNKKIEPEAQQLLDRYSWPGNVRELMNIAERLAVIAYSDRITKEDVLSAFNPEKDALTAGLAVKSSNRSENPAHTGTKQKLDKAVLLAVLQDVNYHYAKAAAKLGISRTTLWRWLKELEM